MSSKGRQQVMGGLGRELAVALEGSVAAGKDAAVQAAEKARDEAAAAARDARECHRQSVRLFGEARLQINAMLEQHAAETSRVVGRGVMCCAFIALLELVPLLILLWVALLC